MADLAPPQSTVGTSAQRWYYWTAGVCSIATVVYLWWQMADEEQTERVKEALAAPFRWARGLRERRDAQAQLTYETFLAIEALDDYHYGRDLREALAVA